MLDVDFGDGALSRIRVAEGVDPLWEIVLSLHLLQSPQAPPVFGPWRREVRAGLERAGLVTAVRSLMLICPSAAYFPDFLTPGRGEAGLEAGVDRVLTTPRRRLGAELSRLYTPARGPVPHSVRRLARGEPEALRRLGEVLLRYYRVAVAPYAGAVRAQAAADRSRRAEAYLSGGAEGLLDGFAARPGWERHGDVLRAPYPVKRVLRLRGRPLTLVPSFFCVRTPLALVDESLPPVLVHPLAPAPGWLTRLRQSQVTPPVAQLIGSSRARLLELLEQPMTTTALAAAMRLVPSTTSRHASVLREAGLLTTRRDGNRVLHDRTPLGRALLDGPVR
ncbi:helix-turn-helix transcriptional regulator [Streptomyces sp. JJ36]|uniref:ArsR/SmtB family transcription factor n=1 Tax=Streptomyces sp. JJ36 TaxID=2736645 RepID=UPI001F31488A|nr:helix-turn-helix domain-containing protein [Streptomyces sp. JJ36]MCF6526052.1 helix-turn-helix transcriptional regulator [Streptomyces sp. JJ36]